MDRGGITAWSGVLLHSMIGEVFPNLRATIASRMGKRIMHTFHLYHALCSLFDTTFEFKQTFDCRQIAGSMSGIRCHNQIFAL
ncbi:uncharacterized protein LY89DRAFT_136730 [Mollisia scopiformis]|uniref:Uncharacterized protein n=1 Tax=Mollisia scopiformis TaxID=149040 RepID=A0A194X3F6_MOLSC|nr:uncharacterized protein LY89DRAFT_136730 [Mollisia scopiformis]KUJ14357.1 hypothetical protein LY89DRAFT_136730 [Mollisia scopiformis]